ncbi:hypothetical protein O3G_MSEX012446 [Manduca sexta]|uniref:Riboflavin transporter n=1 Tax=Manduca sexta TaxID=7130 RepID=A0A921ZNY2_MANSE|nr:hypothetical protein O3G_MSEX012446 [Manduca sexta]
MWKLFKLVRSRRRRRSNKIERASRARRFTSLPLSVSVHACSICGLQMLNEDKEASLCLAKEEGINIRMRGAQRRVLLDVLMMCWGMGTWLGVNGIYVQLPLLVERLPEGWALPSSMVLAVQLANVGLLVYGFLQRLRPNSLDSYYIYGLLTLGTLALVLNAFLYDQTSVIGASERSMAFLTLTFFAALVGCTSSVLFYPYLRHFRDVYLATYFVGEGLSGFIPSILALIQGIGGEPECLPVQNSTLIVPHYPPSRFDSTAFLLMLGALSAVSLVSFITINKYKGFNSERVTMAAAAKDEEATTEWPELLAPQWVIVLALMAVLNALHNGVLPSIQSYSCMPYGTQAYHLAVTLSAMANPAACLAGVWLRPIAIKALVAMLSMTSVPLLYILATALLSPAPPLYSSVLGEALVVSYPFNLNIHIPINCLWVADLYEYDANNYNGGITFFYLNNLSAHINQNSLSVSSR